MDKLKQIESFVSVAAKGSLTAAARAEGVAPAVIGRRIDALEERLGQGPHEGRSLVVFVDEAERFFCSYVYR